VASRPDAGAPTAAAAGHRQWPRGGPGRRSVPACGGAATRPLPDSCHEAALLTGASRLRPHPGQYL